MCQAYRGMGIKNYKLLNMQEKILEVKNLTKVFDGEKAVDGISFFVNAGEITGLLGPNGAGKTTTINMVLGLLEPTGGNVFIFGEDVRSDREETLSRVNFAATYSQLPGNLSVMRNLMFFATLYHVPSPRVRVRTLLKEFDLEQFAHSRTGFLSSGEQSRLSLAKALLNKPKLLLLDEPTASIDPSTSGFIREGIVRYVREERAAVLWTSHNMYEIEVVCDRVLFISHGKILLEGNPRELPAKYGKKNLEDLFIAVAREPLSIG